MIGPNTVSIVFPTKPLGEVVEFLDNLRKPITASDREPGPIPYYGANGQQDSVAGWIFDEPLVLLAEDGGHFDTPDRGIAYQIEGKSWVNNHAHVLRTVGDLDIRWLARVLENYDVTQFLTGSTRAKLTKSGASRIPIPLPPIEEQRRIGAALDTADALRAKRRQALAKLDTLSQAIFIDMFGGGGHAPVSPRGVEALHPAGWAWVPISSVAEMATGHTPDRSIAEYWGGDISWVNLNEIRTFDRRWCEKTAAKITPEGVANSSAVILPAGTVCFSRTASIGFVTVMAAPMTTSQDFVNWICGEDLDASFLMHALFMSRTTLKASSSGSTHKTIYVRNAERFSILLPPRDLQDRYAQIVTEMEKSMFVMSGELSQLDILFASLQQRAFRGDL